MTLVQGYRYLCKDQASVASSIAFSIPISRAIYLIESEINQL